MKKYLLPITLLAVAPMQVQAQIPVTDAASISQQITNITHQIAQLEQLRQQVTNTIEQIRLAESQLTALTGDYGISGLANSTAFQNLRRTPSWNEALSSITTSGASGPIQEAGRDAIEEYGLIDGEVVFVNGDGADETNPLIMAHERSRDAIGLGAGVTRVTLDGDDRRIDVYEAFIEQIGSTPNAKASSDLAARISAENGLLMNELIRLMAINIELQQVALARELANDQADGNFFGNDEEAIAP